MAAAPTGLRHRLGPGLLLLAVAETLLLASLARSSRPQPRTAAMAIGGPCDGLRWPPPAGARQSAAQIWLRADDPVACDHRSTEPLHAGNRSIHVLIYSHAVAQRTFRC